MTQPNFEELIESSPIHGVNTPHFSKITAKEYESIDNIQVNKKP